VETHGNCGEVRHSLHCYDLNTNGDVEARPSSLAARLPTTALACSTDFGYKQRSARCAARRTQAIGLCRAPGRELGASPPWAWRIARRARRWRRGARRHAALTAAPEQRRPPQMDRDTPVVLEGCFQKAHTHYKTLRGPHMPGVGPKQQNFTWQWCASKATAAGVATGAARCSSMSARRQRNIADRLLLCFKSGLRTRT
jgi:hypothetical protein